MSYTVHDVTYSSMRNVPYNLNGAILYTGPSAYNPDLWIVTIVTGIERPSANEKVRGKDPRTNPHDWTMQTYVLCVDLSPIAACRTGTDSATCGECIHRAKHGDLTTRTCYVALWQAPAKIWACFAKGRYLDVSEHPLWASLKDSERFVRVGSFGDPAMVPASVWQDLLNHIGGSHTGYTHQWRAPYASELRGMCSASCDNMADYTDAKAMGWSCFVTIPHHDTPLTGIPQCPASKEMGSLLHCSECKKCNGQHDRWIYAHGKTSWQFDGRKE